jgi:lipid II:glycine glycyltransferase (peptidoglycan interpeptide bridge formation enzyme)
VAAFDGQPQRRYVLEHEGEMVALVAAQERRLWGGRTFWYVPHGPVLDYADPRAADRMRGLSLGLREAARQYRAIAVKLEPRLEADAPELAALSGHRLRRLRDTLQVGQTRVVELVPDEALLAGFDKDTRYSVRRAEREGVVVEITEDAGETAAIDALHELVGETQRRAGFPMPSLERYRVAWRALAGAGRAAILEARHAGTLLASGMVVLEGERSYYLFSGSRREERGETKRYASYALQWAMMRLARDRGARQHDLWGVAPQDAGPDHPWHGVGLFKKGFGGREVVWAGSWDLVVDPTLYRLRQAIGIARGWVRR